MKCNRVVLSQILIGRLGGVVVEFSTPTSQAAGSNLGSGTSCWKVGTYLSMPGGLQCNMHWFPPPLNYPLQYDPGCWTRCKTPKQSILINCRNESIKYVELFLSLLWSLDSTDGMNVNFSKIWWVMAWKYMTKIYDPHAPKESPSGWVVSKFGY